MNDGWRSLYADISDPNNPAIFFVIRTHERRWQWWSRAVDAQQRELPFSTREDISEATGWAAESISLPVTVAYLREAIERGRIELRLYGRQGHADFTLGGLYIAAFLEEMEAQGVDIGGPLTTAHATYFAGAE